MFNLDNLHGSFKNDRNENILFTLFGLYKYKKNKQKKKQNWLFFDMHDFCDQSIEHNKCNISLIWLALTAVYT